jgi:hypothetical protein
MTALMAGNAANRYAAMDDDDAVYEALTQLGSMFGKRFVNHAKKTSVERWHHDPFSRGSYSYIPVGVDPSVRRQLAAAECGGVLQFGGEATSSQPGTGTAGTGTAGTGTAGTVTAGTGTAGTGTAGTGTAGTGTAGTGTAGTGTAGTVTAGTGTAGRFVLNKTLRFFYLINLQIFLLKIGKIQKSAN